MDLLDIFFIAIGLAMDCLAVALAGGAQYKQPAWRTFWRVAFCFGLFQGTMPLIGWFIGARFERIIHDYDHWIAFAILLLLGGRMIEAHFKGKDDPQLKKPIDFNRWKVLIAFSLATSIDALAVGLAFGLLKGNPYLAALLIGLVTVLVSLTGLVAGSRFSIKLKLPAELLGGIVLLGIGTKILLDHLFFSQN